LGEIINVDLRLYLLTVTVLCVCVRYECFKFKAGMLLCVKQLRPNIQVFSCGILQMWLNLKWAGWDKVGLALELEKL